ncbi:MAG: hypothetical protein ACFB13_02215 [Kiloniellaceae bacterium]
MIGMHRTKGAVFVLSRAVSPLAFNQAHAEDGWQFIPHLRADLGYSIPVDDGDAVRIEVVPERDTLDISPKKGRDFRQARVWN